jgi:hypothetical protein
MSEKSRLTHNRASASAPDASLKRAIEHFDAEEYREALLAFEARWVAERSDFLRALIQLCNALNQLRLGLITAPRRSLASAAALLAPLEQYHEGLDIAAIRAYIADVRKLIPDGIESGAGRVDWALVPRLRLRIDHTETRLPPML